MEDALKAIQEEIALQSKDLSRSQYVALVREILSDMEIRLDSMDKD